MTPPKRALFSLNISSNADHIYQRVEDRNTDGKDRVQVREHNDPLVGQTNLEILTRPFEKEVKRSVERIVDGRVVTDTKIERSGSGNKHVSNKVEDKYDTSDL
ncbi:hypothetical protein BU24DRAFT_459040 [Aaosphaeria arxii CBS 175.79]|uniref:Uncharacterized protein n=1 Tax=Aaosphaeria arxii CBS 175.79 TaxID=1450172 RepID=A0A6A5Y1K0_9PLEO|nr:uncharacterized protein BU24DRAFT_459040 [Aaosphaeria arxii CBS 175.79]KAF2019358.1 hypothetical protein BU24DRAFT_459040 [Aaosphaeria arxii CBS 175.79]